MFCVIYQFRVKPGKLSAFKKAWSKLTDLIIEHEGGLGSRLHKQDDVNYIAYAQWPDKQTWQNSGSKVPPEADEHRKIMQDSCENITTLYELDVIEDKLLN